MGKLIDLTGQRFGRLTVIKRAEDYINSNNRHLVQWVCKCDCGNIIIARSTNLKSGNTKSCGCYHTERLFIDSLKNNKYDLTGEYGIGYTSKGEEFYFDLEDYDKIKDYCWYKTYYGYIATRERITKKHIFMHKLILNYFNNEKDIDHINGNIFDNRKNNLRICTHEENMRNQKRRKINKSGIVGVHSNKNKWIATLKFNGKDVLYKQFNTKEEAIKARKEAEQKYYGEFTRRYLEDDEF